MKFRVIIEQDEDGVFIAQCPALPGCVSQGQTRKEAEANIKEAIQGYIESLRKHDEPIPPSITEEIIDIAILPDYPLSRDGIWSRHSPVSGTCTITNGEATSFSGKSSPRVVD